MLTHFSAVFSGHNEDIIHSTKQWERRCRIAICKLVQDQNQYFTSEWAGEHTTLAVRNKLEKFEHIGKVIFDIPFMIQSHAESIKKILGAFYDVAAN